MKWSTLAQGRSRDEEVGRSHLAADHHGRQHPDACCKAGLVEGNTEAGVLASGQVVGMIDDLPSCQELIDRIVAEAVERIDALGALRESGRPVA